MTPYTTIHRIDRDGRIAWVNAAWTAFARDNAAHFPAGGVLRTRLWDYIAGAETRHIHQLLMERAREMGCVLHLPYRCDSPDMRRFMEMDIVALAQGAGFEFRNRVLRLEQRAPVPLLDSVVQQPDRVIVMCNWCKRVALASGEWLEVEQAVHALGLLEEAVCPAISHGVCPDCRHRLLDGSPA